MIAQTIHANESTNATDAPHLRDGIVLAVAADGTGRLLDMDGRFYALSESATELLQLGLRQGVAQAVESVSARYGIAADEVRRDMEQMFQAPELGKMLATGPGRKKGAGFRAALAGAARWVVQCLPMSRTIRTWLLLHLGYASVRILGWNATVTGWQRLHRRTAVSDSPIATAEVDECVQEAASRCWVGAECKERALACWSLLRTLGAKAELMVGIDLFPFSSHAWCRVGNLALSDYADRCARFTPVFIYA